MKKSILLLSLLFSIVSFGQTKILDTTFGANGRLVDSGITNSSPVNIYFENNQYFLVNSINNMICLNYDGSRNLNFGTYGMVFFNTTDLVYSVKGSKLHNGYFYIYGQILNYSSFANHDFFITKISTSGVLDTSFGSNGILKPDLGGDEVINDILFLDDGKIMGIGTITATTAPSTSNLMVVKINTNGGLDTGFNGVGYKTFILNPVETSSGANLFNYNDGILLVGRGFHETSQKLRLIKIDASGNYITNFGTNGFKHALVPSETIYGGGVVDAKLINNNLLYFQSPWAFSFITQGRNLKRYDIDNDVMTQPAILPEVQSTYYVDANQKIYITGVQRCGNATSSNCHRNFRLYKKNTDGTTDTSFHIDGNYEYDFFPSDSYSDDQSTAFYLHDDGKIFIAGYGYNPFSTGGTGIELLRLVDGSLSVDNSQSKKITIINPVSDELIMENLNGKVINEIRIFDSLGKQVFGSKENTSKINVSFLQKGIYIAKISVDDFEYPIKLIKK